MDIDYHEFLHELTFKRIERDLDYYTTNYMKALEEHSFEPADRETIKSYAGSILHAINEHVSDEYRLKSFYIDFEELEENTGGITYYTDPPQIILNTRHVFTSKAKAFYILSHELTHAVFGDSSEWLEEIVALDLTLQQKKERYPVNDDIGDLDIVLYHRMMYQATDALCEKLREMDRDEIEIANYLWDKGYTREYIESFVNVKYKGETPKKDWNPLSKKRRQIREIHRYLAAPYVISRHLADQGMEIIFKNDNVTVGRVDFPYLREHILSLEYTENI